MRFRSACSISHLVTIAVTIILITGGCAVGSYGESAEAVVARTATFADGSPQEPAGAPAPVDTDDTEASAPRLRVFSADVNLSVSNREESRNRIIELADDFGGYTESSSESSIVIRVPAERFDEALEEVEKIGRVLDRSVFAADVTEQFTDLENRLRIARTSRDRLLELLERSDDPADQVRILREIRRLTEEIEQIESSLRSLENQIAYSRITIRFASQLEQDQSVRNAIPFPWIASLDPLVGRAGSSKSPIGIVVPDIFAVFDEGKRIDASSARGVRFRIGAVENDPVGDELFWQRALEYHLSPLYRETKKLEAGLYRGILFVSKDVSPFYYLVMVRIRGEEIILAEAFFPTEEENDEVLPLLITALEEDRS